jgi:glycosyltransferase involved in cell wall biosynthesis
MFRDKETQLILAIIVPLTFNILYQLGHVFFAINFDPTPIGFFITITIFYNHYFLRNANLSTLIARGYMLDYIKLGSPIIISDAYENSLFLKENEIGLIAEPNSKESFTAQIRNLLTDEELYAKLLNNVTQLKHSEKVSWKNRCETVLKDLGFEYEA